MKKALLFFGLFFLALAAQAQNSHPQPPQPQATQVTKNVVLEADGKLYVQSTTVNQVETSSAVVGDKIEKLQGERLKTEENLKRLDESIKELQSLFFELQKKEKRLQKKDEKGN